MKKFLIPIGAFALLVVILAIGVKRAPEKSVIPSALIGKPAPQFVLPELGSADLRFDSQSMAGRWWMLNVWGTWCGGCRDEHAQLLAMRRAGLAPIIGLDWKDDETAALRWLAELGNPYERVAADVEGRVAIDWGVYGAPETFLIGPDGKVLYKHIAPMTMEVWNKEFLPRIEAARAAAGSRS